MMGQAQNHAQADRIRLSADGQDLAFVTVEAVDGTDRLQMMSDHKAHFAVSGGAMIADVGNGDGK